MSSFFSYLINGISLGSIYAIIALGYKIDTADLAKVPTTYVTLENQEDIDNMQKMLDKFNEDDDVNAVFTNWDN